MQVEAVAAGGAQSDGAGSTSVFTNGKFVKKAGLNIPRGYGSSVTLSNGKVSKLTFIMISVFSSAVPCMHTHEGEANTCAACVV